MMVGYENEFEMMQDQIAGGAREVVVVSIVGMEGDEKTTLASKIYTDSFIMSPSFFDEEQDDGQLEDRLQKLLKGRRYLVVIDDIWTAKAWVDMKKCFLDCNNGS
ncbi:hypothetical protein H5410_059611 [Solanum commersonii]|uniref:NB-ARC domain-containing protein n=1 Tax=Solanum commersonii TaxID=4109 RepID=A0A9J5W2W8_SOLCO|nr:hypothetical protein H5410_059611 [Solanum commersonii]